MRTLFRSGPALFVSTLLLLAATASAQQSATTLSFRGAPFTAVVQAVADGTGQRFVLDPRIQTPLTMISAGALSPEAVWQAFTAMLEIHGLEARRVGRDLRIAPVQPASATVREPARVIASSVRSVEGRCWAEAVGTEPVFANGLQRGLRVSPGSDAAEFDRLGFDQGDVVLTVNGIALNDPAQSKAILDAALAGMADVTVELERAGRVQELILYTARL